MPAKRHHHTKAETWYRIHCRTASDMTEPRDTANKAQGRASVCINTSPASLASPAPDKCI